MSSSAEDTMCIQRIKRARESVDRANQLFDGETTVEIETEKHYNYYGDRGVADLFIREHMPSGVEDDYVLEFKSDAAIRAATGANEILRQFNRMATYFYKDPEIDLPTTRAWEPSNISFSLCFNATPTAYEHLVENYEIYETIAQPSVPGGLRESGSGVMVVFPHRNVPVTWGSDTPETYGIEEFKEVYSSALEEQSDHGGVYDE